MVVYFLCVLVCGFVLQVLLLDLFCLVYCLTVALVFGVGWLWYLVLSASWLRCLVIVCVLFGWLLVFILDLCSCYCLRWFWVVGLC